MQEILYLFRKKYHLSLSNRTAIQGSAPKIAENCLRDSICSCRIYCLSAFVALHSMASFRCWLPTSRSGQGYFMAPDAGLRIAIHSPVFQNKWSNSLSALIPLLFLPMQASTLFSYKYILSYCPLSSAKLLYTVKGGEKCRF